MGMMKDVANPPNKQGRGEHDIAKVDEGCTRIHVCWFYWSSHAEHYGNKLLKKQHNKSTTIIKVTWMFFGTQKLGRKLQTQLICSLHILKKAFAFLRQMQLAKP